MSRTMPRTSSSTCGFRIIRNDSFNAQAEIRPFRRRGIKMSRPPIIRVDLMGTIPILDSDSTLTWKRQSLSVAWLTIIMPPRFRAAVLLTRLNTPMLKWAWNGSLVSFLASFHWPSYVLLILILLFYFLKKNRPPPTQNDILIKKNFVSVTIQPFRAEVNRIISHYLAPGSPREINLSQKERAACVSPSSINSLFLFIFYFFIIPPLPPPPFQARD